MKVPHNCLKRIDENIWVVDSEFALPRGQLPFAIPGFLGKCSIRMTIIKLKSGGLFVHSPIQATPSLMNELQNLGPVEFIIGPCVKHNSFLLDWSNLFPKAHLQIAPKTSIRVPELSRFKNLDDSQPVYPSDLKQKLMLGHKSYETLFLHDKSRSLIATDLIYNIGSDSDLLEQLWYLVFGAFGNPGVLRYHRKLIKDPKAFRESLDHVLTWDFDRIIMSHGHIIEHDAKNTFARVWEPFI